MSRADLMYRTLSSEDHPRGKWFSRRELFRDADAFYLTNNAASEVRTKYGVQVEHKLIDGEHCYRVLRAGPEVVTVGSPPGGRPCAEHLSAAVAGAPTAAPPTPCSYPPAGQLTLA